MPRFSETTKTTLALGGLVLALLLNWAVDPHPADAKPPTLRTCFPVELWSAHPADRACYRIDRPAEDGSGVLRLGTAGRTVAVCSIPSLYELRANRTFSIRCRSNGNAPVMVRPGFPGR